MRPHASLLLFASLAFGASAAALFACSTDSASGPADESWDAAGLDASKPKSDAAGGDDAGADADGGPSLCEVAAAYYKSCQQTPNCGDKFPAWCALNDEAVNSNAYRLAEIACLTASNCDPDRRADCEDKRLAASTPTSAQGQLVTAYCQTCEPGDVSGCKARAIAYDAVAGPASTTDIFVAAWEFNDTITDEMRTTCTGGALDAGADAGDGGCAHAFAGCSADVYLAHLPDCPP